MRKSSRGKRKVEKIGYSTIDVSMRIDHDADRGINTSKASKSPMVGR